MYWANAEEIPSTRYVATRASARERIGVVLSCFRDRTVLLLRLVRCNLLGRAVTLALKHRQGRLAFIREAVPH